MPGETVECPDTVEKNDGMLYERTAISKKPEELIEKDLAILRQEDKLTPDLVSRDPYFLLLSFLAMGFTQVILWLF